MNNNSTLFFEYTCNGKQEISDLIDLSFNFDVYNDVFDYLDEFKPEVSSQLIDSILKFSEK